MILKYKGSVPPNMTGCLKYVNPIIVGLIGPNSPAEIHAALKNVNKSGLTENF